MDFLNIAYTITNVGTFYGNELSFEISTLEYKIIKFPEFGIAVLNQDLEKTGSITTATEMCEFFELDGFKDWRLPTRAQLCNLFMKRDTLGFLDDSYWTRDFWYSEDYDKYYFYTIDFSRQNCFPNLIDLSYGWTLRRVRPIHLLLP